MSVRISVLLCFSLACTSAVAASVPSRVDSVVVYPEGATVTRVASVVLNAGDNDVTFTGLVNAIDADRLRVEVADNGVRIGQVRLATEQQRDVLDAEIAAVQLDIDAVTERILAIADSSKAAKLQLTFLEGIATGYSKEAGRESIRGAADLNAWKAALGLLLSASADASKIIRENDVKSRELSKDLSLLQRKLSDLSGGSLATTAIELSLHSNRSVQAEIRLHYFQDDASWLPHYEARLDSNSGELLLAQQASVHQETDEDWTNVKLTLSTSQPGGELMAPTLESEFLNVEVPRPQKARRAGVAADRYVASPMALEEVVVTGTRVARADVGNFAVNYDIPGRISLANDSDEGVTLDLANFQFVAELVTQVVPRNSTQAFLAARFIYDRTLPLYGSGMTVFVDGAYAGNTEMPTALPQAELLLPMGQDRRIEVDAQTQGGEDRQDGIISKRKTEATDYVFVITNRRAAPSYVEVMDLYPVARNKSVDVEVPRTATVPDERDVDNEPGLILWKKTLGPGETWRIRHQYTVSYPADMVLVRE
ncbi:MAG: mucoidy inhibitor MuiA family protein [Gammaproteobacteria bacterium]|nr:mucoidy inhibitor MuiA family protein [Gammaproteobacteria bacterium]